MGSEKARFKRIDPATIAKIKGAVRIAITVEQVIWGYF